jgi:uncharacterized protein YegP (UPF0339 family)
MIADDRAKIDAHCKMGIFISKALIMRFPYNGFEIEAKSTQLGQWHWDLIENGNVVADGEGYESRGNALDDALNEADQRAEIRIDNIRKRPPVQAGGSAGSNELGVLRMVASQIAKTDPWVLDANGRRTCHICKKHDQHDRFCGWQLSQRYWAD